ncbi:MAG: sigma-70 family RNA polymerase sigma factor [Rhodospirillaceae bacterium]
MPAFRTPCLSAAWSRHEAELLRWLSTRAPEAAEDILQETFLRALRQEKRFCDVANPRAWLFETARRLLIDRFRLSRETFPLPEDLAAPPPQETEPVDGLAACLPRVLAELPEADRAILAACDLDGLTQAAFAAQAGLTLPAAKARLRRARARLKARLSAACCVTLDETGRVCGFTPRG